MEIDIDYEDAYHNYYKALPTIVLISTIVLGIIALIVDLSVGTKVAERYYDDDETKYVGLWSFMAGPGSAWFVWLIFISLTSFMSYFATRIIISQKVVATEALLKISRNIESSNIESSAVSQEPSWTCLSCHHINKGGFICKNCGTLK